MDEIQVEGMTVLETIWMYLSLYGLQVLSAIAIFFIGKWVAYKATAILRTIMEKRNVDPTISKFVANIVYVLAVTFVCIAALAQLGVDTTSLAAILAAAGLAIGLALQGSLSNFAAGFMVIMFRWYKVGDYIDAGGVAGTVEEVSIFTTTLKTPDNVRIVVPNGNITDDAITNYSTNPTRRIDLVIGVGYDDDLKKTRSVLEKVLNEEERILAEPAYQIAVSELGDSSVNFVVRPWVNAADYWPTRFDLLEKIKITFDEEGISIPFPQRDIHVYTNDNADAKSIAAE